MCAVLLLLSATHLQAQWRQRAQHAVQRVLFKSTADGQFELREVFQKTENPRLMAIALDVTLGLFGAHRMYLGTSLRVPIIYTATVGGACVLWIVDLGLLIFTKDITPYMDNPNVFMWNPAPSAAQE